MKKFLAVMFSLVCLFLLSACQDNTTTVENNTTETVSEVEEVSSTISEETFSFVLTAGEQGEYGKLVTYNKGTEFEETFYAYFIPEGTYIVTNSGEYMSQVNVYSDETYITDEGWEETEAFDVKLIDVGNSDTITVEIGQHIEIAEPAVFKFEKQ